MHACAHIAQELPLYFDAKILVRLIQGTYYYIKSLRRFSQVVPCMLKLIQAVCHLNFAPECMYVSSTYILQGNVSTRNII